MSQFSFPAVTMPPGAQKLREQARAFVARELETGGFTPALGSMVADDAAFSAKCGEQGFLGMTWPKQYGGHERSALERYVVVEELLAAGAPVMAHWIADRQSGPQILRHGSDRVKKMILPQIAAGRCFKKCSVQYNLAGACDADPMCMWSSATQTCMATCSQMANLAKQANLAKLKVKSQGRV